MFKTNKENVFGNSVLEDFVKNGIQTEKCYTNIKLNREWKKTYRSMKLKRLFRKLNN